MCHANAHIAIIDKHLWGFLSRLRDTNRRVPQVLFISSKGAIMKLSVLQDNLSTALGLAIKAKANRSTLPVLSNVLLKAEGETLTVSANNLEIAVEVSIGAKVASPGQITVPASLLNEVVNSFPPERVDIRMDNDTMSVDVRCQQYQTSIKGIDADEFPVVQVTGDLITTFKGDVLKQALELVTFAASSEESRPIFTGVLFDIKPGKLNMAAADGFRLSVIEMPHEYDGEAQYIIPARALDVLKKAIDEDDEQIDMLLGLNKRSIIFEMSNLIISCNTIQGDFPDYARIIPKQYATRTVADASSLLRSIKLANLFSRDSAYIIKFEISPPTGNLDVGRLDLFSTSAELGRSESSTDLTVEGQVCEVAFNGKYLVDVLSAVNAPQVVIDTIGPAQPGVFRMAGRDDFTHVIMPMHVQPRLKEIG